MQIKNIIILGAVFAITAGFMACGEEETEETAVEETEPTEEETETETGEETETETGEETAE